MLNNVHAHNSQVSFFKDSPVAEVIFFFYLYFSHKVNVLGVMSAVMILINLCFMWRISQCEAHIGTGTHSALPHVMSSNHIHNFFFTNRRPISALIGCIELKHDHFWKVSETFPNEVKSPVGVPHLRLSHKQPYCTVGERQQFLTAFISKAHVSLYYKHCWGNSEIPEPSHMRA